MVYADVARCRRKPSLSGGKAARAASNSEVHSKTYVSSTSWIMDHGSGDKHVLGYFEQQMHPLAFFQRQMPATKTRRTTNHVSRGVDSGIKTACARNRSPHAHVRDTVMSSQSSSLSSNISSALMLRRRAWWHFRLVSYPTRVTSCRAYEDNAAHYILPRQECFYACKPYATKHQLSWESSSSYVR